MRQERHYEVARLKEVDRFAQTFGVIYIDTSRRRNERRAESDECHVDASADDDSRNEGKHISQ